MKAKYDYSEKTVLVTGGATGIGRAISAAFSNAGANVAIANRTQSTAQETLEMLPSPASAFEMDVRDRASVEKGLAETITHFGGVDILVACAGVSSLSKAVDLTDEDWDTVFSVNSRGVFLTNQAICKHFLESERQGSIVNIASFAAKVGLPLLAHYSASKFSVLGWTQALAREMAPFGIRVNSICPGFVQTPMQAREVEWEATLRGMEPEEILDEYVDMTPLGRLETPEDVADLALYLASDSASFITGQGVNTTGGLTFY